MAQALASAGCALGVLGSLELEIRSDELAQFSRECPYPLLATNVIFADSEPQVNVRETVEFSLGEASVTFASYVERKTSVSDKFALLSSEDYLARLETLAKESNLLVLLAASPLPTPPANQLAQKVPNLIVLGGDRGAMTPRMHECLITPAQNSESGTLTAAPRNMPRGTTWSIAEIGVAITSGAQLGQPERPLWMHVYQLPPSGWIKPDQQVLEAVRSYQERSALELGRPIRLDFSQDTVKEYAQRFRGYVGNNQCITCHTSEYGSWRSSPHSNSYLTLLQSRKPAQDNAAPTIDQDCFGCHILAGKTFLEASEGIPIFSIESSVGCESCHGPGLFHVTSKRGLEFHEQLVSVYGICLEMEINPDEETCRECHDTRSSPKFSYEDYLLKVSHRAISGSKEGGDVIAN